MTNGTKNNILAWFIYSAITYAGLWYFCGTLFTIPLSILIGFHFQILNAVIIELRKLNGEKLLNNK
jgi:hypothetical protein